MSFALVYLGISIFALQVNHLLGLNSSVDVTVTETTITLQWSVLQSDLSSSYDILYTTPGGALLNESVTLPPSNDTAVSHTITGLSAGQTYLVEIQKDGIREYVDSITTKPLPVGNIAASSITTSSAYITWTPNNQSVQDSYKVFVAGLTNTSFQFESQNLTQTRVTIPGLTHSSNYSVTIVTYSKGVASDPSSAFIMNTAPLPPIDVTVVAIDTNKLNVTWATQTDSIQDGYILSYTYNTTTSDNVNELTVNVTCSTSDELFCVLVMPQVPGQVYEIRVHSKLGAAVSEPAMTMHSTIPLPISSLTELPSNDTSIHLQWTLSNTTDFEHRHFIIQVTGSNRELSYEINGDQLELPLTNLNLGSMYNVSVIVSTGYEISTAVTQVFYTHPVEVDRLTNTVYQDATNDSITVYWSIPDNATVDNFIIDISPDLDSGFPISLGSDVKTYSFKNLSPGRSYTVSMATKLSTKQSDPVSNTFLTFPNQPTDLNIQVLSSVKVIVTWQAPSGGGVTDYHLSLTGADDIRNQTETGTAFTYDGLVPGTVYTVKLETQSGGLYSKPVTRTFTTNPLAVTDLMVTMWTSHTVTLGWVAPVNTSLDQYEITVSPPDVASPIVIPSSPVSSRFISSAVPVRSVSILEDPGQQ